jgi:hypothetical protein
MSRFESSDLVVYATSLTGRTATIVVDREMLLEFVVNELLPVYNSDWRDPDHPQLSRQQFCDRLELPDGSIETFLEDQGNVSIWLESGDLFTDHGVTVTVDETGLPLQAYIE